MNEPERQAGTVDPAAIPGLLEMVAAVTHQVIQDPIMADYAVATARRIAGTLNHEEATEDACLAIAEYTTQVANFAAAYALGLPTRVLEGTVIRAIRQQQDAVEYLTPAETARIQPPPGGYTEGF